MLQVAQRQFLPDGFQLKDWSALEPFFQLLNDAEIRSVEELEAWLRQWSELDAVVSEEACWRQIRMTCDTTDPALEEAFTDFCLHIEPLLKTWTNKLQRKLIASPYSQALDKRIYGPFLRVVENQVGLFREANIELEAKINVLAQQYGVIAAAMTIELKGQRYTLQQAARFLQDPDRALRKEVFIKINERRLEDREKLEDLFDELLALRHQVARNAGFENYRDYKFRALGRFDYSVTDCEQFHEAVRQHILPLQERILKYKAAELKLARLAPFDVDAVPVGQMPLRPFETGGEFMQKSIAVLSRVDPYFGSCLHEMQDLGRLDVESREGKAPGGYNCPLAETGVPFIFMNAAGTVSDVITMMHESGHAAHSFLSHELPLSFLKEYPMEIAELASMSMELFSMEEWSGFFSEADDLARAKRIELERVITVLPWIAVIDKYQHWLYTHPGHSRDERRMAWEGIQKEFAPDSMDWTGLEAYRQYNWQKQLHLYEVPFYYIEYGIAQLGAVAMWRAFKADKQQTLDKYMQALRAGFTKTLPELYEIAGIKFSFAPEYINTLKAFMGAELEAAGIGDI